MKLERHRDLNGARVLVARGRRWGVELVLPWRERNRAFNATFLHGPRVIVEHKTSPVRRFVPLRRAR